MSAFAWVRRLLGGRRSTPCEEVAERAASADADIVSALTCGQVTTRLYDYMDDALDPALKSRIERHLTHGSCECRRALLMELAFDERIRDCVCNRSAPDSLRQRIRALLT